MAATSPSPSGIVNVTVSINGSELSSDFQILSINILKEVNKISTAFIAIIDGDPALQKFEISNKSELVPGNEVIVKAGYDSEAAVIFKGIIIKHGIKLYGSTSYTYIECKDKAIKMTFEKNNSVWEKKKDSDIIKELASKYGLTVDVEASTYQHPQIMQFNSNDWDFCLTRAEIIGKLVFIDDGKFSLKKPNFTSSPNLTLQYGQDILEFESELDSTHQVKKVKASSWDFKEQKVVNNEASSSTAKDIGNITSDKLTSITHKAGYQEYHSGFMVVNELKDWSEAKLLRSKMSKVIGRVKCLGFSNIKPGDIIEIKGISDRFNDKIFVSGIKHEIIEGGWTTDIQFGLSSSLFPEKFNINAFPSSGLLPSVNGLQIGVVKKIDGDPDSQYRIQISLPLVDETKKIWARMAFADAGNKRGVYFIPEVNDEVIVGFLNEDPRFPVILGTLYSSKKKTPITTDNKNKEKGIFSREGIKVLFDDDKKILTLQTPNGNKAILDDDKDTVTLQDKSGNKIILKQNLISIEGKKDINIKATGKIDIKANQDVTISGLNIKNAANAKFEAKGNAGAEVSTSAIAILKGSLVKIN